MRSCFPRRGHAVVEFALAFPFALAFFFVLIDLSLLALRQSAFEAATRRAARRLALEPSCDASPSACLETWLSARFPDTRADAVARAVAQRPAQASGRAARRVEVLDVRAMSPYVPRWSLVARFLPNAAPSLRGFAREVRVR